MEQFDIFGKLTHSLFIQEWDEKININHVCVFWYEVGTISCLVF